MYLNGVFHLRKVLQQKHVPDYWLLFLTLALLAIGLVMIYSASYVWAEYTFDDSFYYVKRQLLFISLGLMLMGIIIYIPFYRWQKLSVIFLISCFVLLIIVLMPGVGMIRGGARSWIGVGAFSIQPAEFMKLGIIIYLATVLANKQLRITSFFKGFLPLTMLVLLIFSLIMLQPDFGTGLVIVLTCMLILFIAGAKWSHMFSLLVIGLIGFSLLIITAPYRLKRITAFLNPWEDPLGDGFQIIQSLYAIGPGGLIGVGLGNSLQKYFYLPEPQTDFIFSIIAEEVGLIGAIVVLGLFMLVCWRGIRIALYAQDRFATYLAFGITGMIMIQVAINISVVIGLIPVTGITLPFISYGGSSLLLTICAIGLLLNISKYTTY